MKKRIIAVITLVCASLIITCYLRYGSVTYFIHKQVKIEKVVDSRDRDYDGIPDMDDIVQGARKEVNNKTEYKSVYYQGGYPPDNEGVCTDVIWRALKNAGYDLKYEMDGDIRENTSDYQRVNGKPDPNIDFRRVKNQYVFFNKFAQSLTLEIKPNDIENLKQWQGGDIVILANYEHIAIISDKRRRDGVPYIIHNASTVAKEEDKLLQWYRNGKIIGHFRYPAN